jgi:site-specific DNA recombinase
MRYLIYTRVSPKGSGHEGETTCADQAAQCRAYCLARDPEATFIVLTDELWSGGDPKRPGWRRIVESLESGRPDFDAIAVRHLDRLSRSLNDCIPLLSLLQKNEIGLISVCQQIDLATPTGRAMLSILLVFAQWEREMGSERTKMKMVEIAKAGKWPVGRPPVGYRRAGKGNNVLEIDPIRADHVRTAYAEYLEGVSPQDTYRKFGWPRSTYWTIMRNPTYVGKISYDGNFYDGLHEKILDERIWNAVQARLGNFPSRSRPGKTVRVWLLQGLLRCVCGCALTPATATGRAAVYAYYQCTDHGGCRKRIRADKIETSVIETVCGTDIDPESVEIAVMRLRELRDQARTGAEPLVSELDREIIKTRKIVEKAEQAFLDGLVNQENAARMNKRLSDASSELSMLESRKDEILRAINAGSQVWKQRENAIRSFANTRRRIEEANENRAAIREILLDVIDRVEVVSAEKNEPPEVKITLGGSSKRPIWLPEMDAHEPHIIIAAGKIFIESEI